MKPVVYSCCRRGRPQRRARVLRWLFAGLVVLYAGCATRQPPVYRGMLVSKEVQWQEEVLSLACALTPSQDCRPRFLVTKHRLVTCEEVPIFQKVIEIRVPDDSNPDRVEHRVIPDEYIRGGDKEKTTRSETIDLGPWKDTTIEVGGVSFTTDANGIFVDDKELLLGMFDDWSKTRVVLSVKHPETGEMLVPVTRQEFLDAFGIKRQEPRSASREGIAMSATFPEALRAGDEFEIRVDVRNDGDKRCSSVCGRAVSRHSWLDGKNFYFGCLDPGKERSFTRTFRVPTQQPEGTVFAAVGFWDVRRGAMPEKGIAMEFATRSSSAGEPARAQ